MLRVTAVGLGISGSHGSAAQACPLFSAACHLPAKAQTALQGTGLTPVTPRSADDQRHSGRFNNPPCIFQDVTCWARCLSHLSLFSVQDLLEVWGGLVLFYCSFIPLKPPGLPSPAGGADLSRKTAGRSAIGSQPCPARDGGLAHVHSWEGRVNSWMAHLLPGHFQKLIL